MKPSDALKSEGFGVYEGDDGRAVVLAIDPMQTVAAGDPRLARIATTVREKLERVLERLV